MRATWGNGVVGCAYDWLRVEGIREMSAKTHFRVRGCCVAAIGRTTVLLIQPIGATVPDDTHPSKRGCFEEE